MLELFIIWLRRRELWWTRVVRRDVCDRAQDWVMWRGQKELVAIANKENRRWFGFGVG